MRSLLNASFLFITAFSGGRLPAVTIIFKEKNAEVWLPDQSIQGRVTGLNVNSLLLYCNNTPYTVTVNTDGTFKVTVKLHYGENNIRATCGPANSVTTSDQLNLTLGYRPVPVVTPYAVINNSITTLNSTLVVNPSAKPLKYKWTAVADNPAVCTIQNRDSKGSPVTIPALNGIYRFNLQVTSGPASANYQTYVKRDKFGLHAYHINSDHAGWIDSAVIYEINPSVFVKHGTYDAITAKLEEIKSLGINTIWLQPMYQTNDNGQGYSVTDFFKLRGDYGTEKQLADLIATAKSLHLRVLFDFVPNHTSIYHPYAVNCVKYGDSSHYYKFYQRTNDGKAYSSFYHKDKNGFFFYFWDNLVNLDYNNPEVQQWMLEATKYWLKKFDIDGYRFDAMWGLNARSPQFIKRLNTELKSIKPDMLLLAEDKPSDKLVYQSGFDATYDWTADTSWVSQWSWQTHHNDRKSFTIFNSHDTLKRSALLNRSIFLNGDLSVTRLRFLENNDVPRFITTHTLAQTKMAAALLFALPGIPMLYNGQEAGCGLYPYSAKTIFTADKSIQQSDTTGLFTYYKKIIKLHSAYPALYRKSINKVTLTNSPYMLAFGRGGDDQRILVVVNLNGSPANAHLNLSGNEQLKTGLTSEAYLKDILTDNIFKVDKSDSSNTIIPMEGYGIRWLLLTKI